ncbi:Uma2 family endonuclease [Thermoactinospora rubra]|uniref:Uma2 family endonuclease n=1 Tax=Thermoactinospora rubra TaxID=1088767 RepID=UPI000A10CE6B|nr:Uma2 family endonuclease [Thermoactinospora rubra]
MVKALRRKSPVTAHTARELFDVLPEMPGFRAEVIKGNLIVSPLGPPPHGDAANNLHDELLPLRRQHGWRGYPGNVGVCIEGTRDPVEPDYVLAPRDCPLWGEREFISSGLILVAEVVSPGSKDYDRNEKPGMYADGGVPIYLLIDPLDAPPSVTVYSDLIDGAYKTVTKVEMGMPLRLPKPVDFELDTSVFKT